MSTLANMEKWQKIGCQLDQRSKLFSLISRGTNLERDAHSSMEGVILWDSLIKEREIKFENIDNITDWNLTFSPLLHELLHERGGAAWICIGHFTGTRDSPHRRWLYYLSEELSPATTSAHTSFTNLYKLLSFNAEYRSFASKSILLTSQLIDVLTAKSVNDLENKKDKTVFPYGVPLLLKLNPASSDMPHMDNTNGYEQLWTVDVSRISAFMREHSIDRLAHLDNATDNKIIHKILKSTDSIINFLWKTEEDKEHYSKYHQELIKNASNCSYRFKSNSNSFLNSWTDLEAEDSEIQLRLNGYVGWILDGYSSTHNIFTIPGWLPSEGEHGRSGAMIICFKREIPTEELLAIANSFRLGCSNWAVATGEAIGAEYGLQEASSKFAHQVKSIGSKVRRWTVSEQRWNHISEKFKDDLSVRSKLKNINIAPAPELYEALGRVLVLWSFSYNPIDIFPDSDGHPPKNLAGLVREAWNFALASCFLHTFTPKAFDTSDKNVHKAWTYYDSIEMDFDASCIQNFSIVDSMLKNEDGRFFVTSKNHTEWKELSGLLRFLVLICENFLDHSQLNSVLEITASSSDEKLTLHFTNPIKSQDEKPECRTRTHLGVTGRGVMDYICSKFLERINAKLTVLDKEIQGSYRINIEMDIPSWLTRN